MRDVRPQILATAALALAACNSGHFGDGLPEQEVSPGTVTFRLMLPPTRSFCDSVSSCGVNGHITFTTSGGEGLDIGPRWCTTQCSSQCTPSPCPLFPCTVPTGVAVTQVEQSWDGAYADSSTCGNAMACYIPKFARPGRYVARMCATPGTLTITDSAPAPASCTPTGPAECVDVPFDFPGASPVEASLPVVDTPKPE
jgi:hypothetical protein